MTVHGGCDRGTYALLYERNTSPLRLRVCEKRALRPSTVRAMVKDGAHWGPHAAPPIKPSEQGEAAHALTNTLAGSWRIHFDQARLATLPAQQYVSGAPVDDLGRGGRCA